MNVTEEVKTLCEKARLAVPAVALALLGWVLMPLGVVLGGIVTVRRFRRSTGLARQQLKWVALAGVAAGAREVFELMRTEVTAGQYLDLLRAAGGLPGPDGALRVARYKSAGYTVQRPLQLGAAIAGAGPEVADAYASIGATGVR